LDYFLIKLSDIDLCNLAFDTAKPEEYFKSKNEALTVSDLVFFHGKKMKSPLANAKKKSRRAINERTKGGFSGFRGLGIGGSREPIFYWLTNSAPRSCFTVREESESRK
jgi:hypothetical protein